MYDTTDVPANSIPADAQIVAGYIDGHYRSFAAVVARCPNAVHIPIAVFASTNGGQVLDCESGDATPSQCPGWIKMRRAAGVYRPTIYCEASAVGAVKQACAAAGLLFGVDWDLWIAHYDGRPSPDVYGEVAKQFINHGPHGENCDVSAVFDDNWPHGGQTPSPTPPEDDMAEPGEAVDFWMANDGTGYVLDRAGAIHPVGNRPLPNPIGDHWWANQDVARKIVVTDEASNKGYVLDREGGIHEFGGAPKAVGGPYWPEP